MKKYNPQKIEKKWQSVWQHRRLTWAKTQISADGARERFGLEEEASDERVDGKGRTLRSAKVNKKPKYYILDMFPYPSGDGLHMGHTESYTASDIIYRYKKLQGFDVLHPQGFDSFGLPAENYAIKTGVHPKKTTETNSKNYLKQMRMLGFGHDLEHLVYTSDPLYYKWTQFLFGKFFENGLVEQKTDTINWCPSCNTGIANEQVEDGKCERCKTTIEQRKVPGWFFKITDFADELIDDLDKVDWPEHTIKNQRNWIGKSEGASLNFEVKILNFDSKFKIQNSKLSIKVFTTRPDTLFGATYMVVAPEHPLVQNLLSGVREEVVPRGGANSDGRGATSRSTEQQIEISNYDEVVEYVERAKSKTELERVENKEKTGVELKGIKAINPVNDVEIPIFVADYVLAGYGTGAIMAVPAHDERDWEFAKKYGLEIKYVVHPTCFSYQKNSDTFQTVEDIHPEKDEETNSWLTERLEKTNKPSIIYGKLINSEQFTGQHTEEAKKAITKFVGGEMTSNYRLRDWSISRQRYWGCPIPIVYSPEGKSKFVGEENLPWLLPEDVDFVPTGTAPLKKSRELRKRVEKLFGKGWTPEVDTMDTFVDSSWYFLRYPDTENEKEFCSKEKLKRWMPVDLYIGGAEHTYMHLLYARFFIKAMKKIGLVNFSEPFTKLCHQGMVLDKDGVKMSKSKGNVTNPNDMVKMFGADATRMYMMFAGPLEDEIMFKEEGVKGVYRFLEKIWNLFQNSKFQIPNPNSNPNDKISNEVSILLHKTIKGVTEDIENLKFNTAISKMMIFTNTVMRSQINADGIQKDAEKEQVTTKTVTLPKVAMEEFLILLAPFAPHITEELWSQLGNKKSIFQEKWPKYDPKIIKDETIEMVIQVNGKVRDKIQMSADISEDEAKGKALASEKVQRFIDGKKIKKVIFVKGKLISLVV